MGLQSFMHEESSAIGSLRGVPRTERARLARASHKFNARNEIWREYFAESSAKGGGGAAGGGEGDGQAGEGAAPRAEESLCRFCFSSEGDLISPCMCKGSNEWPVLLLISYQDYHMLCILSS